MSEGSSRNDNLSPAGERAAASAAAADMAPQNEMISPQDTRITQALVLLSAALSMALYWYAGRWLDIPAHRGFEGSLLQQPGASRVLAIAMALLLFLVCTVLGQILAGRRWMYAGLFAAAVGLAALSARGGASRYVLFHAAATGTLGSVFLTLLFEQLLLFTAVGAVWFTISRGADVAAARAELERVASATDRAAAPRASSKWTAEKLQALAAQIVIMTLGMLLFVHADAKKTVALGVFATAFASTALIEYWFQNEKMGAWYWIGPLAVGVIGYLINHLTGGGGTIETGQISGMFAPLARPLPLDYASMGTAGALLGYWIGAEHPGVAAGILLLSPEFAVRSLQRTRGAPINRLLSAGSKRPEQMDNGKAP